MTAVAKLPEKWLAKAATCRADAERLGEGNPVHNELLRDAAQYEQCAHALKLALSPAELGGVEAVAWMIDAEFVDAGKVRTFSATKPNPDMWGKATFTPLYATTPRAAEGEKAE